MSLPHKLSNWIPAVYSFNGECENNVTDSREWCLTLTASVNTKFVYNIKGFACCSLSFLTWSTGSAMASSLLRGQCWINGISIFRCNVLDANLVHSLPKICWISADFWSEPKKPIMQMFILLLVSIVSVRYNSKKVSQQEYEQANLYLYHLNFGLAWGSVVFLCPW